MSQAGSDFGSEHGSVENTLTAEEIAGIESKNRAASDAALNASIIPGNPLMASFHGHHAVDGDRFFQHQDDIEIIPGIGLISNFVVKRIGAR